MADEAETSQDFSSDTYYAETPEYFTLMAEATHLPKLNQAVEQNRQRTAAQQVDQQAELNRLKDLNSKAAETKIRADLLLKSSKDSMQYLERIVQLETEKRAAQAKEASKSEQYDALQSTHQDLQAELKQKGDQISQQLNSIQENERARIQLDQTISDQKLAAVQNEKEVDQWKARVNDLTRAMQDGQKKFQKERIALQQQQANIQKEFSDMLQQRDKAQSAQDSADQARTAALSNRDVAVQECNAAEKERDPVRQERGTTRQERDTARQERDTARQERDKAQQEREVLRQERNAAWEERNGARQEREAAQQERDIARRETAQAQQERDSANRERDELQQSLTAPRKERHTLIQESTAAAQHTTIIRLKDDNRELQTHLVQKQQDLSSLQINISSILPGLQADFQTFRRTETTARKQHELIVKLKADNQRLRKEKNDTVQKCNDVVSSWKTHSQDLQDNLARTSEGLETERAAAQSFAEDAARWKQELDQLEPFWEQKKAEFLEAGRAGAFVNSALQRQVDGLQAHLVDLYERLYSKLCLDSPDLSTQSLHVQFTTGDFLTEMERQITAMWTSYEQMADTLEIAVYTVQKNKRKRKEYFTEVQILSKHLAQQSGHRRHLEGRLRLLHRIIRRMKQRWENDQMAATHRISEEQEANVVLRSVIQELQDFIQEIMPTE